MLPIWAAKLWANQLVRKILMYILIGVVAVWGFKVWLTRHDERIQAEGEKIGIAKQEKLFAKQQAEREKAFEEEKTAFMAKYQQGVIANENRAKVLNAREEEIVRARRTIDAAAVRIEAKASSSISTGYEFGRNLSAGDAINTIRKLSRELESSRATPTTGPANP